jgi:hypothetical protein
LQHRLADITNPPAIGEVGNAAGEYIPGAGAYCRINGTPYDANANGAPKVADDYNYPWPKAGAAAGAPGSANAAAYFWRQNATRQIWCDKTSPDWPQTCKTSGTWKCPKGGTPIFPPPDPQTCYLQSTSTFCTTFSTTYSPTPTCNTDPSYDLGGCVGTECQKCTATTTCTATNTQKNGACHITANGGPPGTGGTGAGCNCVGPGGTLPACPNYQAGPTSCSKGGTPTLSISCTPNAGRCDDLAFDSVTFTNRAYTLLEDSNMAGGTGSICRHSNFDYAAAPRSTFRAVSRHRIAITGGCPDIRHPSPSAPLLHRKFGQFCDTPNDLPTISGWL